MSPASALESIQPFGDYKEAGGLGSKGLRRMIRVSLLIEFVETSHKADCL